MDKKLLSVMAYFCTNIKHKSDLSKARLTKLVYLADWKKSQTFRQQITNIKWLFNHYGPYVDDIKTAALTSSNFIVKQTLNQYGSFKEQFEYVGNDEYLENLSEDDINVLNAVINETEGLYFNKFIEHVYDTFPVISTDRYSILNLPELAKLEYGTRS